MFQEMAKVTLTITPKHLEPARKHRLNLSEVLRKAIESMNKGYQERKEKTTRTPKKTMILERARWDLNPRLLAPEASDLSMLGHGPNDLNVGAS